MPKKFIIMEKSGLIIIIFINNLKTKFIALALYVPPKLEIKTVEIERIICVH